MDLSFDFLKGNCLIRISSSDDLDMIASFYNIKKCTVNYDNWEPYPYLFYNDRGLHGAASRNYYEKCVDFSEWAEYVGIESDIEESGMDIEDLLFS